jgi:hypothetical protein
MVPERTRSHREFTSWLTNGFRAHAAAGIHPVLLHPWSLPIGTVFALVDFKSSPTGGAVYGIDKALMTASNDFHRMFWILGAI